ncbi:16727_t:CDS:1 [Acaulospora colombiana]|uniref:16727_t:CDS:1 n=1 Tax=Acaulospora colombiana TaxID=27376 RepID=A0ACA9MST7_9GLOM|nr:16727_t:CDS:1 [Acaulospora colombiana]
MSSPELPNQCIETKNGLGFISSVFVPLPKAISVREPSHEHSRSSDPEAHGKHFFTIIQMLQRDLNQLEFLYTEKSKGLEEISREYARLECYHYETLEMVQELREEIKKRDISSRLEAKNELRIEQLERQLEQKQNFKHIYKR